MLYLQIDIRKNITKNERDVVDMIIDYKIIGKRIKAERAKHKFTQEEMAEKLNTSVAFYSRIETGRSHVNLTRIMEIANILNVSAGYFLTGIEEDGNNYLYEDFKVILEKCTPKQQKFIYKMAEVVSEELPM